LGQTGLAIAIVSGVTLALRLVPATNPTTVALSYLLVVLFVASSTHLVIAVATSFAAMLALNFFFLPPIGTLTIADSHNWVALVAFLVVAVVASNLSATARRRTNDAVARRHEVARLFDLSRDILLTTEVDASNAAVASHVARRFESSVVAICRPAGDGGWSVTHGGSRDVEIPVPDLDHVWVSARGGLEFDARTRSYGGHREVAVGGEGLTLVPIRIGTQPIGVMALGRPDLDAGTADAVAGIVAVAIERAQFLSDQQAAQLARQRADLSSTLLASLGHDLRTPLTAIRVAVSNAQDAGLDDDQRRMQARLALGQLDHLGRLLQEILDMARIEARAVRPEREWVTPAEVVDAAMAHVGRTLDTHVVRVEAGDLEAVDVDPRLTSAALAHVLENAARYSPAGSEITIDAGATAQGLGVSVTDSGPGLELQDMERLFEPFFRGHAIRQATQGTGLGLAISRGLLAAEGGRIWAENVPGHGARFTISVPGRRRPVDKSREAP
jgi:two-component system sensor histidine kinase KdpD